MNKNVIYNETSDITNSNDKNDNFQDSYLKNLNYEKVDYDKNENKILNNYLSEIQNCEENIKKFQIIGYVTLLFFFLLFLTKVSLENGGNRSILYYYLLIPSIFSVFNFTISINFFIKLKNLVEEIEEKILNQNESPGFSFGNFLAYLSANFIALLIIIFMILFVVKIETNFPVLCLHLVNIPMFILLGIMTFYSIFVMPALVLNKFYWGIILIFSYLINSTIFFIFATLKFDYHFKITNKQWFIPIFIAIFIQLIFSLVEMIKETHKIIQKVFFACSNFLFLTASIYTSVILDDKEYQNKATCILLYTTAYFVLIIERISVLLEGLKENEDKIDSNKDEMRLL